MPNSTTAPSGNGLVLVVGSVDERSGGSGRGVAVAVGVGEATGSVVGGVVGLAGVGVMHEAKSIATAQRQTASTRLEVNAISGSELPKLSAKVAITNTRGESSLRVRTVRLAPTDHFYI